MNESSSYRGEPHEVAILRREIATQISRAPSPFEWDEVLDRSTHAAAVREITTQRAVGPDRVVDGRPHWTLVVAGAMLVVVVGALMMIPRWTDPEAPATTNAASSAPTVPQRIPAPVPSPTLFPALPVADPRDAQVSGGYGTVGVATPSAQALVARVDGETISDSIMLQVFADDPSRRFGYTDADIVTVNGVTYDVYSENGTPVIVTVVQLGTPTIAVTGVDPFGFIDAAGGVPITDAVATEEGDVSFAIGELPAGYDVIVEPEPAPNGSRFAQLILPSPSGGEGSFAQVHLGSPFPFSAMVETVHRVDINGVPGWIDDEAAFRVAWQVDATTWATASGASERDALDLARSIEFIDEASWRERYDVEPPPTMPLKAGVDVTATTSPDRADQPDTIPLDQLGRLIVEGTGTDNDDMPERVEINMGTNDGIKVGMPVVNAAGLVGKISQAEPDTSIVLLITSPEFTQATRIIDARPNPTETIVGTLRGQGAGRPLAWETPRTTSGALLDIQLRDTAITSGGPRSLAPDNIPVGTVTKIIQGRPDASDPITAAIEPNADLEDLTRLTVLLYTPEADG